MNHTSSTPPPVSDRLSSPEQVTLLSGAAPWRTEAVPRVGLDSLVLCDGPHGIRRPANVDVMWGESSGSRPATCFPPAVSLGSTWDVELAEEVGQALGREARAQHVSVLLGPGLNLKRHPRGGRSFEYVSEDPLLSGRIAGALVRGIQSQGVGACPKHFAVNNQESHRMVVDAVVDPRTLHELYLRGFELVVQEAGPWTMMCSYNRVNGEYTSQHHQLLTDVLRERWGFDGVVMSDWGAVDDRARGVEAGLDLEMPGGASAHDARLVRMLDDGSLDADAVARSVDRLALLHDRVEARGTDEPAPLSDDMVVEHHALARRAAAAAATLLSNDGVLPLATDRSVALVGAFLDEPRYQGTGSSRVVPTALPTLPDALGEMVDELRVHAGTDVAAATTLAADADVAIVSVGLPTTYEAEGFDRDHLSLPPEHDALVRAVAAANPRTVVVVSAGAAVVLPWADDVAAVLHGHLGGQAGAEGLADVLVGATDPGGRLAETFPVRESDLPAAANFPGTPQQVLHREGPLIGYRAMTTLQTEPAFCFGHGLSYTSFTVTDLRLSTDRVSIEDLVAGRTVTVSGTVTNTGDRAGTEVVQLYVRRPRSRIARVDRELASFRSVHLDAGDSTTVELVVDAGSLRHFDVDDDDWAIEEGPAELLVGRSSERLPFSATLHVGDPDAAADRAASPRPPRRMDDTQFAQALGRPLPSPRVTTRFHRNSTVGELSTTRLGAVVHDRIVGFVTGALPDDSDEASVDALARAIEELPLRNLVQMSDGSITFADLAALLDALNGRWSQAVTRLLRRIG